MPDSIPYLTPRYRARIEIAVSRSRFITTIDYISATNDVKALLSDIRMEMPDATHHVYAFRIGYGNSVIEGSSDAGEPRGTAGSPILRVLRGTDIGDILIVVTRYFGGTKLGMGGLVRAYTEAAHAGLANLQTERKIPKKLLTIVVPYHLYETVKRLIVKNRGTIESETFTTSIAIALFVPVDSIAHFMQDVGNISAGQIQPKLIEAD